MSPSRTQSTVAAGIGVNPSPRLITLIGISLLLIQSQAASPTSAAAGRSRRTSHPSFGRRRQTRRQLNEPFTVQTTSLDPTQESFSHDVQLAHNDAASASTNTATRRSRRAITRPSPSCSHHRNTNNNNNNIRKISNRNPHQHQQVHEPYLIHSSLDPTQESYSNDVQLAGIRGGDARSLSDSSNQKVSTNNNKAHVKTASTGLAALAITLSILHWDTIKSCFDREKFRTAILKTLNDIASKGNKGLLLYTFGFIWWEVCGLPTSVVETAAGMAFGFQRGLLGSFIGKTCGSIMAFTLGRTLLSDTVGKKIMEENNKSFELIERGVAKNPVLSTLVIRYSPFPQLIKNYMLSITKPVSYPIFILAICIHGFPFSLLWAALGNDSRLRLLASEAGEIMAANVVLNSLLLFVTIFGFVISPAVTGWWLADLRRES